MASVLRGEEEEDEDKVGVKEEGDENVNEEEAGVKEEEERGYW